MNYLWDDAVHFTKHHGLGNDFLVALESNMPGLGSGDVLGAQDAVFWCDRRRGIGADGLLLGCAPTRPGADLEFRLFNSDGSVAEISGNGIRCLAQAELRRLGERRRLVIDTPAGRRDVDAPSGDPLATTLDLRVGMGPVQVGPPLPPDIGSSPWGSLRAATGNIGNPHVVLEVADPEAVALATLGPEVEAAFPGGINVHVVSAPNPTTLDLRVWERGSGITEACGSGASVAAWVAAGWGLVGNDVTVRMPGGTVRVELGEQVYLTGPTAYVAEVRA